MRVGIYEHFDHFLLLNMLQIHQISPNTTRINLQWLYFDQLSVVLFLLDLLLVVLSCFLC